MRCSVKETQPHFLLTDGSFFISAFFTADSYKQFRANNSNVRVIDLKDVMVLIKKWSVELSYSKDENNFTSYAGVEMRMVIHEMEIVKDHKV